MLAVFPIQWINIYCISKYLSLFRTVLDRLRVGQIVQPEAFQQVTIGFTAVIDFGQFAVHSTPIEIVLFLNGLYTVFDDIIEHFDIYKVETIQDSYMVSRLVVCPHLRRRMLYQPFTLRLVQRSLVDFRQETNITTWGKWAPWPCRCFVQWRRCECPLEAQPTWRLACIPGDVPPVLLVSKLRVTACNFRYYLLLQYHVFPDNKSIVLHCSLCVWTRFGDTINTASRMCTVGEGPYITLNSVSLITLPTKAKHEEGNFKLLWLL